MSTSILEISSMECFWIWDSIFLIRGVWDESGTLSTQTNLHSVLFTFTFNMDKT